MLMYLLASELRISLVDSQHPVQGTPSLPEQADMIGQSSGKYFFCSTRMTKSKHCLASSAMLTLFSGRATYVWVPCHAHVQSSIVNSTQYLT